MRLHLKTLDDTREEIKRLFEVTSQEINVMNKKLEALETKNIILMQRQAAIEQKESNIEDQVCELRKTLSAEASFSKGNCSLILVENVYNYVQPIFDKVILMRLMNRLMQANDCHFHFTY